MGERRIIPGVNNINPPTSLIFRRDIGRRNHPAPMALPNIIPAKVESPATTKEIANKIAIDTALMQNKLVHRTPDEAVDLYGIFQNNVTHGVAPIAVNVVQYQCPNGCVVMIDQFAVYYSDPLVAMSTAIGWRLTISDGQAPNIRDINTSYIYTGFGDLSNPNRIHPLWIQSGQTVSLQVNPSGTFGEFLTVTCRLSGKLFKPSVPEVLGV